MSCGVKDSKELLHEYLALLQREDRFRDTLVDHAYQRAFDLLVIETWTYDEDVIAKSGFPIMDAMNLLANVHNKRCLESLKRQVEALINDLPDELQETIGRRLRERGDVI